MKNLAFMLLALLCATIKTRGDTLTFSENEGRQALANIIQKTAQTNIVLMGFKKTDGQKSDESGIPCYQMDFEAVLQFEIQGAWEDGEGGVWKDGTFMVTTDMSYKDAAGNGLWAAFYKEVSPGSRAKISGILMGQKSEKGWKIRVIESRLLSGPTGGSNVPRSVQSINSQDLTPPNGLTADMFSGVSHAFSKFVANRSHGNIRTQRFFPTLRETLPGPKYLLDYRSEIEFQSNGTWVSASSTKKYTLFSFTNDATSLPDYGKQDVERGDRAEISGELTADKTERGWRFRLDSGRVDWIKKPPKSDKAQ